MKRILVFYLCCTALVVLLFSCGSASSAEKKGDKYYDLGEYFDAATEYKKAYTRYTPKERTERGKVSLKLADSYERINYTARAIASYRNAIRYKQADSATYLHLGMQLLKNGNYKEAEKILTQARDSMPGNELIRQALISARTAPTAKKQKQQYTVKKQNFLASRRADYSPVLYGDAYDFLYFSSTRKEALGDEVSGITGTKNADIFYVQKDDKGKWGKVQTIESGLNTEYDEGAAAFSPDGKTMYLTQCLSDPSFPRYATIATAQRSDAAWGKATTLEITKDTLSSYAHPAVSPDGQWLYFVSDMPGGEGGLDIWRVRITTSGLGGVENLGRPVNTSGDEMFPTFRPNGDLYFSSTGHPGLGGLDIYIAHPDSAAKGGFRLEHPGYPLNSQGDDFGMTFEGLHNRGYFSSNRGDARGWDHIYSFERPDVIMSVKGWVYEKDGYELPAAEVRMVGNDGTNKKLSVKMDGSFTEEIKPGVDYMFLAMCKGYLNVTQMLPHDSLDAVPQDKSHEWVLQFPLASVSVPVLINNIFYDFDKATLRPESTVALDSLVAMLGENKNITIELRAHTDSVGSDKYNKRLSQRRAESVVNYLISKGIPKDRLSPVGYGEEMPKKIYRRLAERYPFLKEGDVLTPEFISRLPKEQQEICNQLNRRTEFLVLRTTYGL